MNFSSHFIFSYTSKWHGLTTSTYGQYHCSTENFGIFAINYLYLYDSIWNFNARGKNSCKIYDQASCVNMAPLICTLNTFSNVLKTFEFISGSWVEASAAEKMYINSRIFEVFKIHNVNKAKRTFTIRNFLVISTQGCSFICIIRSKHFHEIN